MIKFKQFLLELTANDLLDSTPGKWKRNAVKEIEVGTPKFNEIRMSDKSKIKKLRISFPITGITSNYTSEIEFVNFNDSMYDADPEELRDVKMAVTCSCPAYKYFAAYANKSNEKSGIYKQNLGIAWTTPAVIRNPENEPRLCKHLVKVLKSIRKKTLRELQEEN